MKSIKRLMILSILAMIVLALPVTVFAGKKIFKARLTQEAVVNSVQLSNPSGVGILGLSPGGVIFQASGSGLETEDQSDASISDGGGAGHWSAHIHGPAPAGQNAPIVVKICGDSDSILASCNVSKDGFMKIMGKIGKNDLIGMSPSEFLYALNNGELYMQVHLDGTPIIRGQFYEN